MPDLIRDCLGIEVGVVPETVFEQAHDELDLALPKNGGLTRGTVTRLAERTLAAT